MKGFRREELVATLILSLPSITVAYLPASVWSHRGACITPRHHDSVTARVRPSLFLKMDDLPDESKRQMAAADQRVKEVEEEYWKSLDADELAIERKRASALACLKSPGMLATAAEYYTQAAELSLPSSRTWPLGLALYFLGRYDEAAVRLETDIRCFERQFEECATDERIWQAASWIRGARESGADMRTAAAALPPLPIREPDTLRRTVYNMFRGDGTPEDVRRIGQLDAGSKDYLGLSFFSEVFLALYHDARGNELEAEKHTLAACRNAYPKPDDLWYHTPRVHARARAWTIPG